MDRTEPRRRRARMVGIVLAVIAVAVAATAAWAWLPWRRVGGLAVVDARVLPAHAAGKRRIAITFSAADDPAAVRARYDVGVVAARLLDCADPERDAREVIAQRDEYMQDRGRVVRLAPMADGRATYRATFDDDLARHRDGRTTLGAALDGRPLCFTIDGGSMWLGPIRAATIPLPPLR